MDFQFLGGASEVGRLGMVLKKGPTSLLFDYGLLPRDPPQYPMPAPPVDGMFISHAHLDHTGMIPWVTRRQDVDVVLTPPTADVANLLLEDSLKIADAEGFDAPFDDGDLRSARRSFRTVDFGDNVDIGDLEVTAHPAGHIPGATMYEVNGTETTLFTGDLHTLTTDLVWGARPVHCDTLFIESTYAGRPLDARQGPARSLAGWHGEEGELDLRREPGVCPLREGAAKGDESNPRRAESAGGRARVARRSDRYDERDARRRTRAAIPRSDPGRSSECGPPDRLPGRRHERPAPRRRRRDRSLRRHGRHQVRVAEVRFQRARGP